MVVYVCCSSGSSSSVLCKKIKNTFEDEISIHYDTLKNIINNLRCDKLKEYELILAYGPTEIMTPTFIKEMELYKFIDLIITAPQIRFYLPHLKKVMEPYGIPCTSMDLKMYGASDEKKLLKDILSYKK